MVYIKQRRSGKKKWISIFLSVFIILSAASFLYLYVKTLRPMSPTESKENSTGVDLSQPTEEQIQSGNDIKKQVIENDLNNQNGSQTEVSITITSSNISNDILRVRSLIDDVSSDGKCILTLTENSTNSQIKKETGVQVLANSSTCKGFDIPLGELSASNKWNVDIEYVSINSKGETTKSITIDGKR